VQPRPSTYDRFVDLIVHHPIVAIVLALVPTVLLALQIPKLRIDTDMTAFMPRGDDARENLDMLEEVFGSSFLTKIIIVRDDAPDGIYDVETLAVIDRITRWLETRPEFETSRSSDLRSFSTTKDIRGDETGMVVKTFMEEPPADRAGAQALRRAIERNGMYVGLLTSYDGKAAAIFARESEEGRKHREQTYSTIRSYLDGLKAEGRPETFYVTGRTIVEGLFGVYITEEGQRMLPFVLVLLGVFLYGSFRSIRGVVIPALIIVGTELWMFGFLAVWGHPVYTVTTILQVLITAIAVADSIHLLAKYYEAQADDPSAERPTIVRTTMHEMGAPVLMTSVTTAVGFLAMTSSPVEPLFDFGIIAAVGIFAAFVLTVVLIPALLALLPLQPPRTRVGKRAAGERRSRLESLLVPPAVFADSHPVIVVAGFAAIIVTGVVGAARLSTDSSQIGQFRPGHHLRVADELDNARFSGGSILDVIVEGEEADALKDPELLRRIDRFQSEMEKVDDVGDTFSIVELIKRMNRVMNEDRPDQEVVPDSRDLVAQYLLLYSISGDPGDFDDLVDYDYRSAHLLVFIRNSGTAAAKRAVAHASRLAAELFPPGQAPAATVRLAGSTYTNAHLEGYVNASQLSTLVICAPLLFVLTWMLFGKARYGLLSILPVSIGVLLIYGTMGFIGLPTDLATTMLSAMALGIGIDFAIHYLYRYLACMQRRPDAAEAARVTAATAGRALFYNAVVLAGGFCVLLGARFYPQVKLGALVSATMVICYVSTMLLFPAALRLMGTGEPVEQPASLPSPTERAA